MKIQSILILVIAIMLFACKDNSQLLNDSIKLQNEVIQLQKENDNLKEANDGYPNLNFIKKSLIDRKVDNWTFAALSEFKDMKVQKEIKENDIYEAYIDIDLEDYRDGKYYFMKIFVTYKKVDNKWILNVLDAIEYFDR